MKKVYNYALVIFSIVCLVSCLSTEEEELNNVQDENVITNNALNSRQAESGITVDLQSLKNLLGKHIALGRHRYLL